jgi:transposase, IS5 family
MRPKERRESGQNDLFQARLDQIVDMDHPLALLSIPTIDAAVVRARPLVVL